MSEADPSATPEPEDSRDVIFWRRQALRVIRRQPSKGVARRLRLPAERWPWPDAIESPMAVKFEDRAWLFERLAAAERTVDYAALCRAGREAHARILDAAAWLEGHPSLRERLRGRARWSAVDALDGHGSELFHACRPSYTLEAEIFQEGTLGARISRVLERRPAAGETIPDPEHAGAYENQAPPEVRLAGWVLLGDGSDSAVAAERTEIVSTTVLELDNSTRKHYEQAMAELDRALLEDALAWDEGVLRRQVDEPLVEQLNRRMNSGSL
jgi:hypothetical protein